MKFRPFDHFFESHNFMKRFCLKRIYSVLRGTDVYKFVLLTLETTTTARCHLRSGFNAQHFGGSSVRQESSSVASHLVELCSVFFLFTTTEKATFTTVVYPHACMYVWMYEYLFGVLGDSVTFMCVCICSCMCVWVSVGYLFDWNFRGTCVRLCSENLWPTHHKHKEEFLVVVPSLFLFSPFRLSSLSHCICLFCFVVAFSLFTLVLWLYQTNALSI